MVVCVSRQQRCREFLPIPTLLCFLLPLTLALSSLVVRHVPSKNSEWLNNAMDNPIILISSKLTATA